MQRTEYLSELRQDVGVHVAAAPQESGLHRRRHPDARARHRRHDRDLQRGLRRRAAAAAAARSRAADARRRDLRRCAAGDVGRQLRRHERRNPGLRGGLSALNYANFNLSDETTPERVVGARVTANYFDVMGVRPMLGRTFTADEDRPGNDRVVVLSHRLWTRRFGASAAVVGRDAPHERRQLHGHRRDAGVVRPHHRQRGAVGADRVHAGAARDARRALPHRLRPPEARTSRRDRCRASSTPWPRGCAATFRKTTRRSASARVPFVERFVGDYRQRLLISARGGRARAAHRLRQRRQSAAGARRGARAGDCRPHRARRRAMAHRPAAADRERRARALRPRARACCSRAGSSRRSSPGARTDVPRLEQARIDPTGARLRHRHRAGQQRAVRPGAGAARVAHATCRPDCATADADRPAALRDRLRGGLIVARGGAVAAAALRRRTADSQRDRAAADEPRLRSARRPERARDAAGDQLHGAGAHRRNAATDQRCGRARCPASSSAAITSFAAMGGGGGTNGLVPEGREATAANFDQQHAARHHAGLLRDDGRADRQGTRLRRRRPRRRPARDDRQRAAGGRRRFPARIRSASGSAAANRGRTASESRSSASPATSARAARRSRHGPSSICRSRRRRTSCGAGFERCTSSCERRAIRARSSSR